MQTTLDFQIRAAAADQYQLEVFRRDSAQPLAAHRFDLPLSFLTSHELRALEPDGKDPATRIERLKAFGAKLYQKLFSEDIRRVWAVEQSRVEFLTLCLRFAPDAVALEALPWEALYDGTEFLAASGKSGVMRLPLDLAPQPAAAAVALPLRLFSFVASPLDLREGSRLQVEREQEILLEAVNTPAGQGKLHIEFEDEAKLAILENSLTEGYHIFHFTGHGIAPEQGGGLLLEDDAGQSRPTANSEFIAALQKGAGTLRLAVLSGCQTARTLATGAFNDLARSLVRRAHLPAVVAMQFSITDTGGLKFAERLYPRLIEGLPLDLAVSRTRREMWLSDDPYVQGDAFAPVLIATDVHCLKSRPADDATVATALPQLDASFFLPLPQLGFGFYGRRREYREIRDALLQRNQRAVILHGIGGIGKTALVAHAAQRLRKRFKGVYAFDCAGGLAPEKAVYDLHQYFARQGINALQPLVHQSMPPDVLANYVAQVLTQWPLLLIFDNFESLLERAGATVGFVNQDLRTFIATLVKATAAATRFLFTSRYLFDLDDKRLGNVQSIPLADLSRPETLMLMQKLAHLAAAGYDEKLAAYQTFGGHPYALVALDRYCNFRSLREALDDARGLHTELREFLALELNYAQLSEDARELLNRLAAFRQDVPREAADWVMGERVALPEELLTMMMNEARKQGESLPAIDEAALQSLIETTFPEQRQAPDLMRPIRELIEWGLLTPLIEHGQLIRLFVHNLVRNFCAERQAGAVWQSHLRDAAAFYTNQTKLIERDDKEQAAVWSEMEAFELFVEAKEYTLALSLLTNADALLDRWGYSRYLENQYLRLLPKVNRSTTGAILHNHGILLQKRGDYDGAMKRFEAARKIAQELEGQTSTASSLYQMGMIYFERGEYAIALEHYEASLRIHEELGNRAGMAISSHEIAMVHQKRGDYDAALQFYKSALRINEELRDRENIANSLHQIGKVHQLRGEYQTAQKYYEESLQIEEKLGNRMGVAISLGQMGQLNMQLGHYVEAFPQLLSALAACMELESPPYTGRVVHDLNTLRAQWGKAFFDSAWLEATGYSPPEWVTY